MKIEVKLSKKQTNKLYAKLTIRNIVLDLFNYLQDFIDTREDKDKYDFESYFTKGEMLSDIAIEIYNDAQYHDCNVKRIDVYNNYLNFYADLCPNHFLK